LEKALFRFDASPEIGGGHAIRSLALADHLAACGWEISIACSRSTVEMLPRLKTLGYQIIELDCAGPEEADYIKQFFQDTFSWVIVDHYGRDEIFEKSCRKFSNNILAIDDLADRSHDCDVLLDQTLGRQDTDYRGLVPDTATVLTGPSYSLLRPEFSAMRQKRNQGRHGLFINFGLYDSANLTELSVIGLSETEIDFPVNIALGRNAPNLAQVSKIVERLPEQFRLHIEPENIAELMASHDLYLGAAGSTVWEICCLGIPSILIVTADNQRGVASAMEKSGAAICLGDANDISPNDISARVTELFSKQKTLSAMALKSQRINDGWGAGRLAAVLANKRPGGDASVRIRPATDADAELILAWQSHKDVRRYFRNPKPPSLKEHMIWFENQMNRHDSSLNIILCKDFPAGIVRLDYLGSEPDSYEVSVLVSPDRQRLGIAKMALSFVAQLVPSAEIHAWVDPRNDASKKLFLSAGYMPSGDWYKLFPAAEPCNTPV